MAGVCFKCGAHWLKLLSRDSTVAYVGYRGPRCLLMPSSSKLSPISVRLTEVGLVVAEEEGVATGVVSGTALLRI